MKKDKKNLQGLSQNTTSGLPASLKIVQITTYDTIKEQGAKSLLSFKSALFVIHRLG